MTLHHSVACFLKLSITRKILSMKGPIRMRVELFVAFVEAIGRQEKCFRIRNVNGNGHIERAGRFPHCVESFVVDLHKRTGGYIFAQVKTESLENLETARACLFRSF